MIELVRKRHDGDGWIVFEELGDRPGLLRNRSADAVALGVWASTKYEAHLYEFKISREDVKRELRDPSKAEGVGQYCTYWWLAISDPKIINELVIPEAWGIVCKKKHGDKGDFRLVTLRKAPRLKPKPIGVHFAVSMIRNMAKRWVEPAKHRAVAEELDRLKHGDYEEQVKAGDLEFKISELERQLRRQDEMIELFQNKSGVELGAPSWDYGNIGEAVRVVRQIQDAGRQANGNVLPEIAMLSRTAEELESQARELARAAVSLRVIQGATDHAENCRSRRSWGGGRCNCGLNPLSEVERKLAADAQISSPSGTPECAGLEMAGSHRGNPCQYCGHTPDPTSPTPFTFGPDDDEGSGGDRRSAGSPEQDAGVQLRDQRAEVPHGEPTP